MAVTTVAKRIVSQNACQSINQSACESRDCEFLNIDKECNAPAFGRFHFGSCHRSQPRWSLVTRVAARAGAGGKRRLGSHDDRFHDCAYRQLSQNWCSARGDIAACWHFLAGTMEAE